MAGPDLVAKHPLVPGDAGEPVRLLARFLGPLRRGADRTAVNVEFAGVVLAPALAGAIAPGMVCRARWR